MSKQKKEANQMVNPTLQKAILTPSYEKDDSVNPPKWREFTGMDFKNKDMASFYEHRTLKNADFTDADLTGADFTSFNLQGSRFIRTKLSGAKFIGADLRWCVFDSIDEDGTADFTDADARESKGLTVNA